MSRVGINPVTIPSGVEVTVVERLLTAKGNNGELKVPLLDNVDVEVADDKVTVKPQNMSKKARQAWGTTRALINNAVLGASTGFTRRL